MTSKAIVLKILDGIVIAFLGALALTLIGPLMEWMPQLFHMSAHEFRKFSMFMVISAMWLTYTIATSDSAP